MDKVFLVLFVHKKNALPLSLPNIPKSRKQRPNHPAQRRAISLRRKILPQRQKWRFDKPQSLHLPGNYSLRAEIGRVEPGIEQQVHFRVAAVAGKRDRCSGVGGHSPAQATQ